MNEAQILSLVASLAVLVFVGSSLRGRVKWANGLKLGVVWLGIFIVVTLFVAFVAAP
jgi:hypothetical protein